MSWYDLFSSFYDKSLEPLYAEQRLIAASALQLSADEVVLDLPCGTGLSFDAVAPSAGHVIAVDFSKGMLAKAEQRAKAKGFSNVTCVHADVTALTRGQLPARPITRLHVFLGLTAFPDWENSFARLFELLEPGGRCVVIDVYAEKPTFQGRMVNLVARADITRKTWEPLQRLCTDFSRRDLPSRPDHGGQLYLATGLKAATP